MNYIGSIIRYTGEQKKVINLGNLAASQLKDSTLYGYFWGNRHEIGGIRLGPPLYLGLKRKKTSFLGLSLAKLDPYTHVMQN